MPRISKEKNAEYQKKWYQNNRELQIQRNMENRRKKIDFVKEYKSSRGCSRCDEKHVACLQFHHKNPEEKESTIRDLVLRNLSIDNIMKEIDKCEILCSNCHFKHHYQERIDKQEEPDII